jgi:uncharacterized protein (UPF0248 family)
MKRKTNKQIIDKIMNAPKDARYWKEMYLIAKGEIKYHQKIMAKIKLLLKDYPPC